MQILLKYPKTFHVPWSSGLQNDDRMHPFMSFFTGREVVATAKLDGENTNMYPPSSQYPTGHVHARSLDSGYHPSRTWVKSLHARIASTIPPGWHLTGENLYAKHSIHYHHLKSYFYLFTMWDEQNRALSWDDTVTYAKLLGLETVPVFYRGVWDRDAVTAAFVDYQKHSKDEVEGYVFRLVESISYELYQVSMAKWVRRGHVQTSEFWMKQPVIPNGLEGST